MKLKSELVLLIGSLLLCLILFEALAQANLLPFYEHNNINTDGWWKEKWLRNSKYYSSDKASYEIDKYDPYLGYTLRENLTNFSMGNYYVNSNSKGIRGKKEYTFNKSSKKRILVFGDSFTFGDCVNDNETYSYFLQALCPSCEVLNMGIHGYGLDQQLLRLELKGVKYKPDIVILGFVNEDIFRDELTFRDYFKPIYIQRGKEVILETSHIMSPEKYKTKFKFRSLNYFDIIKYHLFPEKENENLTDWLFQKFVSTTSTINATTVFVYLPIKDEVIKNQSFFTLPYKEMCGNKKIVCINPIHELNQFIVKTDGIKTFFGCHYSPEIHRVIAEKVDTELQREGLI